MGLEAISQRLSRPQPNHANYIHNVIIPSIIGGFNYCYYYCYFRILIIVIILVIIIVIIFYLFLLFLLSTESCIAFTAST